MIALKAGGVWLDMLGFVGDVNYKTRWPGGFLTVSWRMVLPAGFTHPALRQGTVVEVYDGGLKLGFGIMAEPDRVGWNFTADGMALRLAKCLAFDGSMVPTTNLTTAINAAAGRGWQIAVGDGVPNTSLSSLSEGRSQVNTIPALADAYCANTGQRWWVDAAGLFHITSDPVDVSVVLTPGAPAMATADDDYASLVVVRYASAVSGTDVTGWDIATAEDADAASTWGPSEMYDDETANGLLSALDAADNAQAILDANRARPRFAQAVEVGRFQVTTLGGTSYHLPFLRAGLRVRQHGVLDNEGNLAFGAAPEWVIGGTDYTAGSRVVTLSPVDLAPRTVAQIHKGLALANEESFA